jgi:hypothetical protein
MIRIASLLSPAALLVLERPQRQRPFFRKEVSSYNPGPRLLFVCDKTGVPRLQRITEPALGRAKAQT